MSVWQKDCVIQYSLRYTLNARVASKYRLKKLKIWWLAEESQPAGHLEVDFEILDGTGYFGETSKPIHEAMKKLVDISTAFHCGLQYSFSFPNEEGRNIEDMMFEKVNQLLHDCGFEDVPPLS